MHSSEAEDLVECLNCGAEIAMGADRVYPVTEDSALCFECAIARGGVYDELHDVWTNAPDLSGLGDPRASWAT